MYNPSLKPVLIGIGVGIVLFAIPFFLIKAVLFFLIFGALVRFVGRRLYWSRYSGPGYHSRGHHRWHQASYGSELHPAFVDSIRNMSDEEYDTFRQKLAHEQPSHSGTGHKTTIEIQ